MKRKNSIFLIYLTAVTALFNPFPQSCTGRQAGPQEDTSNHIYGITIDDTWENEVDISRIIKKIKELPQRATVRIVMSADKRPEKYKTLFQKIHQVADIMACPVDSSEMILYRNIRSYKQRFAESYKQLKDVTDIWETANEINGEGWLGNDAQFIADKTLAALRYIKENGGKTAITTYYTRPGEQKTEMSAWLEKYIPQTAKEKLDYLFVSYYEDDNAGYIPDWQSIFTNLEKQFPHAKLGIGECGSTRDGAGKREKQEKYNYYYTMPKYTANYVGGYFWWYWVQDVVINQDIR